MQMPPPNPAREISRGSWSHTRALAEEPKPTRRGAFERRGQTPPLRGKLASDGRAAANATATDRGCRRQAATPRKEISDRRAAEESDNPQEHATQNSGSKHDTEIQQ